jgi:hypothetical protein
MGFFSSKTVINTGTVGSYLYEGEDESTPIKDAIIASIAQGTNMSDAITAALLRRNLFDKHGDRYYNYGKDHFINGLPEGYSVRDTPVFPLCKQMVEAELGRPVNLLSAALSLADNASTVVTATYVQSIGGIVTPDFSHKTTVTFEIPSLATYYGKYYVSSGYDERGFITPEVLTYSAFGKNGQEDDWGNALYWRRNVPVTIPLLYPNKEIYVSTYTEVDAEVILDNIKYWYYIPETHVHDDIINAYTPIETGYSPFYPIAPIRVEKTNTINLKVTENGEKVEAPLTVSTRSLLKKISVDLSSMTSSINKNPDIGVIDSAFVTYTVDLQSKNQTDLRYLFDFFEGVYERSAGFGSEYIEIRDGEFHVAIEYDRLVKSVPDEVIVDLGYVEDQEGYIAPVLEEGEEPPPKTKIVPGEWDIYVTETRLNHTRVDWMFGTYYDSSFSISCKHPERGNIKYDFLNLKHKTFGIYRNRVTVKTLHDSLKEATDSNPKEYGFYIPLSRHIVESYEKSIQNSLHYRSLILIIYSEQRTKLKFYERAGFAKFIKIVGFVVLIASFVIGPEATLTWEAFVAAAIDLVVTYAITLALEGLADLVGGEIGLFIAAIAQVYAIYLMIRGDITDMPTADMLLKTSTIGMQVSNEWFQDEGLKAMQETEDYLEETKDEREKLEKLLEEQEENEVPWWLLTQKEMYFDPNEGPSAFYHRSVHNTNPGVLSLDTCGNYVARKLRLPKANEPERKT